MNFFVIFFLCIVEAFSFGILLSTFTALFFQPTGLLSATVSHAVRAQWLGIAFALTPFTQFLSAGFLGQFSDQFGRKQWLLISIAGIAFSMLLLIISISFKSLSLLFLSRIMAGLFAGYVAIAQAAIADMSSTKSKVSQFNYMELSLGLGMLLGPLAGSLLLNYNKSVILPYELNLGLMIILFFVCYFFFREKTLIPASARACPVILVERGMMSEGKSHPFVYENDAFIQPSSSQIRGSSYFPKFKQLFANKRIKLLLISWAIFMLGWTMYLKFFTNFLQEAQHFNFLQIGHIYVFMGLVYLACQIFIVRRLAKKIDAKKWTVPCMLGVGVCMIWMGLTHSIIMLYMSLTVYMITMALFLPCFHAWLSNEASVENQGAIFGISVSLHALMGIISGILGGELLALSSRFTLYGAGIFIFLAFLLLLRK